MLIQVLNRLTPFVCGLLDLFDRAAGGDVQDGQSRGPGRLQPVERRTADHSLVQVASERWVGAVLQEQAQSHEVDADGLHLLTKPLARMLGRVGVDDDLVK